MKQYHVFIIPSNEDIEKTTTFYFYRDSFKTLQEVMELRFTAGEIEYQDMRQYRAICYMVLEDGSLSLIRFSYCSRESPWGSWYDVNHHQNYGYQDERRPVEELTK